MVNAWSLLWEELNGTMDETYPIKKEDGMTTGIRSDVTVLGGEDKSPHWYDWDRNGRTDNPFDTLNIGYPVSSASSDTITFTGMNTAIGGADTVSIYWGGAGNDHISFSDDPYPTVSAVDDVYKYHYPGTDTKPEPNLQYKSQKYEEEAGIKDLKDYISSTYSGHYTSDQNNTQTLDLIQSVGDAESFCRSNAIKYLARYDKKGQAKRDILKAMHYCLLLYYFSGQTNNETPTRGYETF